MSLSDLVLPSSIDDDGFDDAAPAEYEPAPAHRLARLVLEAALNGRARRLLISDNSVVILHAPDKRYANAFKDELFEYRNVAIHVVTERKKSTSSQMDGAEVVKYLARRRTVVFITQDPEGLLDAEVRAAADLVLETPSMPGSAHCPDTPMRTSVSRPSRRSTLPT